MGGVLPIPAQAVCNSILQLSFEENIPVSPMKLQKLLYFVYRDYLKETDELLFSERFEAWPSGPVLPSVYSEFKSFCDQPITKFAKNADGSVSVLLKSFNRFLIISLDVLICRYSPLLRAFPALFISEEPHKSFYCPSCFHSQK